MGRNGKMADFMRRVPQWWKRFLSTFTFHSKTITNVFIYKRFIYKRFLQSHLVCFALVIPKVSTRGTAALNYRIPF